MGSLGRDPRDDEPTTRLPMALDVRLGRRHERRLWFDCGYLKPLDVFYLLGCLVTVLGQGLGGSLTR